MASRKSFFANPSYIFASSSSETGTHFNSNLELDEADLWKMSSDSNNPLTEAKKGLSGSRSGLKRGSRNKVDSGRRENLVAAPAPAPAPSSLPVNIPDWSKILKEDYKEHHRKKDWESEEDELEEGHGDGIGGINRMPPHEYLARTRGASLSVHEGIGRTLKGRDLRSVRNAIWKKVGFED